MIYPLKETHTMNKAPTVSLYNPLCFSLLFYSKNMKFARVFKFDKGVGEEWSYEK